ncbi:hypothetical protein L1987_02681 [Smallanthus sonchifolius]|uniref:Uncharacterized protein n=1 Tax=Smallanthus sonchifolius TaxID=185202 RepID=A0ACB9K8I6_9ASTR|nr:hypothetical protein L1987_02681 [Smallanthus sonchifolius]
MPGQAEPVMPDPLQGMAMGDPPHIESIHDQPPQHPRHVRQPVRLDKATQALLDGLVADSRRQTRYSERMEDLIMWICHEQPESSHHHYHRHVSIRTTPVWMMAGRVWMMAGQITTLKSKEERFSKRNKYIDKFDHTNHDH